MRILLALLIALVSNVTLEGTTLVIFTTARSVVIGTDSAAVRLDANGPHHVQINCKIRRSGTFWFVIGGFLASEIDERDVVAAKIATVTTVADALTAIDDPALRERITAHRALYAGRPVGSPLMTIILASPDLTVGVYLASLATADPFTVTTETATCPGQLCPTGGYYLVGEPGDAPRNPLLKALPPWFQRGDAAAARQFITEQIAFTPELARPPVDVLEINAAGARWVDRQSDSACAAIPAR